MPEKIIFVFSDTHIGSIFGLWKPFIRDLGIPLFGGKLNEILYSYWEDAVREVNLTFPEYIFFVGDHIDGKGTKKENGRLHLTTDLDYQKENAVELFKPLIGYCKEAYMFRGTHFHNADDTDIDRSIARELGIPYCGAMPRNFDINGKIINVKHGASGGTFYRATAMDKISLTNKIAVAEMKQFKADLIIRGHLHFFGYLEYASQAVLFNPCFQHQTEYMATNAYSDKMIPDIGYTKITVPDGERPIKVEKRVYPYPIQPPFNTPEADEWVQPETPKMARIVKRCLLKK